MDWVHLESSHRLHEDQPRLQELLRRTYGAPASSHGTAELCQWLRAHSTRGCSRTAAAMEEAANHIRQFDERHVSRRGARRIHYQGVRRDATSKLASLPGFDKAIGAIVEVERPITLGREHLDGCKRRERCIH